MVITRLRLQGSVLDSGHTDQTTEEVSMQGVCCNCQEVHDVRPARRGALDLDDEDFVDEGEQHNFVMADHKPTFGGGRCDGVGSIPQALMQEGV